MIERAGKTQALKEPTRAMFTRKRQPNLQPKGKATELLARVQPEVVQATLDRLGLSKKDTAAALGVTGARISEMSASRDPEHAHQALRQRARVDEPAGHP